MTFGENVKTAAAGALKRRSGLLRDNLRNSPKRKALLREKLKRCGVRMWKITVGDPRQNHCSWRSLSAVAPEGISEILGPETKPPRWETLSTAARYLKFEIIRPYLLLFRSELGRTLVYDTRAINRQK